MTKVSRIGRAVPHVGTILTLAILLVSTASWAQQPSTTWLIQPGEPAQASPTNGGPWRERAQGVQLHRALRGNEHAFWFSKGMPVLADGTVTLRFRAHPKTDLSLLTRSTPATPKRRAPSQGLRIQMTRRSLTVSIRENYRWRRLDRKTFPLPKSERGRKTSPRRLVVTQQGPVVVAQLFSDTQRKGVGSPIPLAEVSIREKKRLSGHVGLLLAGRKSGTHTRITALSLRSGCARAKTGGYKSPAPVFVTVNRTLLDQVRTLSPSARVMKETRPKKDVVVVAMNPMDAVTLRCEAVSLERVSDERPYKYMEQWQHGTATYMLRGRGSKCPMIRDKRGLFPIDRSYHEPSCVNHLLEKWHKAFPNITRLETIGRSHRGTRIRALRISADIETNRDKPAILLNGAHHGIEAVSVSFVLDAIQQLLRGYKTHPHVTQWLQTFTIWAVPVVNPDGLTNFLERDIRMGRKNGRKTARGNSRTNGVDLNRNYPFRWGALGERGSKSWRHSGYYRGPKPASEPEVRAMMALADRERFVGALTYHTGTLGLLVPYTIDEVKNPVKNEAWSVAEQLVKQLPKHPERGEIKVKRNLYSVDGTDQDWHRHTHGTLALLVEGARRTPATRNRRQAIVQAIRPLWKGMLNRFQDGPSISGHVLDLKGKPVCAAVSIDGVRTQENERWMTRFNGDPLGGSGRFDRYLPGPGRYTVSVDVPGQPTTQRPIRVQDGHQKITIQLPFVVESPANASCEPTIFKE